MANLLHIKGSRNKILNSFPNNRFGDDGDIVIVKIQGKGVYLCLKSNGTWYVSNKLEQLRKLEKTSIKDLKVERLKTKNTTLTQNKLDVGNGNLTLDVGNGNLTLDASNDIELNADGGQVTIKDNTANHFLLDCDNTSFTIYDDQDEGDLFKIQIAQHGATTITTIDDDGAAAHLKFEPDGSFLIKELASAGADLAGYGQLWIKNSTPNELYFVTDAGDEIQLTSGTSAAGGGASALNDLSDVAYSSGDLTISSLDTIISGSLALDSSGDITLDADGDQITIKFGGATGQIDFTNENSGDGVIQQKVDAKDLVVKQYDGDEVVRFTDGGDVKVTNVVYFAAETANTCDSSGGAASATVDWNASQKQKLTITGTSNTINFTNPAGPCNLQLKIVQGDGNDTITAGHYSANVKWAGGARPTLSTANGAIDIVSFYFDGTSYHGVASLNFATI